MVSRSLPPLSVDPSSFAQPADLPSSPLSFLSLLSLDPLYELEQCGGCRALGSGQDCTALSGARSVGCEAGACKVYSCAPGFTIATNGTACVKNNANRGGEAASLFAQSRRSRSVRARR